MALKFLGADGSGTISDAVDAITYAVDSGAVISNNSWGGNEEFSQALYDAVATPGRQATCSSLRPATETRLELA